jgi:4'-phosphopantetheinyl transferase
MNANSISPFELNPENLNEALLYFEKEWKTTGLVVFYSMNTFEMLPSKETFLSHQEIIEFESMSIDSRQKQFLTSRWMIKTFLSSLIKINPNKIQVTKGELGKPLLAKEFNPMAIDFNISHKSSISLIGLTDKGQIGVDVEENIRNEKTLRIAERYFHAQELDWIKESKSEVEYNLRFYRIWSMKEAIVKTLGGGVFQNLNEFCLEAFQNQFKIFSDKKPWAQTSRWRLMELKLPHHLIGSVSLFSK